MSTLCDDRFRGNGWPTLGVEIELQLVDARTMALRSACDEILATLPAELQGRVKPELMQCALEINTEVCREVAEVERDLTDKLRLVDEAARRRGARGYGAATPTS